MSLVSKIKRVLAFRGRCAWIAAWALIALAAGAIALACCGAERAGAAMRTAPGIVAAGAATALLFAGAAWVWRRPAALMMHLGLALVLGGWIYNRAAGVPDGYLQLHPGRTGSVAGEFEFSLDDFRIERWEDTGTVRQYRSLGRIRPPGRDNGSGRPVEIAVNKPLVEQGWWVYQNSYRELRNPHTGQPFYFSVLHCVKDIGLPYVAAGAAMLLLGALVYAFAWARRWKKSPQPAMDRRMKFAFALYAAAFAGAAAMLVHRGFSTGHPPMQNMYEFLMCMAAFIPVLTFISWKRDAQNTLLADALLQTLMLVPVAFFMNGEVKRLMPALQSPLFVPHVGSYVAGYVLLVRAALGAGRRLAGAGFALLTAGLVLGALWGKICWGNWWQFDPKEMWSLATWFTYAAYFHVKPRLGERGERVFLALGAVLIVLTLTWINLSRMFSGMHSYA